jgi:hypothetical protein
MGGGRRDAWKEVRERRCRDLPAEKRGTQGREMRFDPEEMGRWM